MASAMLRQYLAGVRAGGGVARCALISKEAVTPLCVLHALVGRCKHTSLAIDSSEATWAWRPKWPGNGGADSGNEWRGRFWQWRGPIPYFRFPANPGPRGALSLVPAEGLGSGATHSYIHAFFGVLPASWSVLMPRQCVDTIS